MKLLWTVPVITLITLAITLFASTGVASAAVEWCTVGSPPPMHTNDSVVAGPSVGNGAGDPSKVPSSAYQTPLVSYPTPNNGKGLPTNYTALAAAAGGMTSAKSAGAGSK